ncbi:MAG: hypothetical protein ACI9R3_001834 [Verrucomicrobiales bacterium]|jgi:hypothetical protein
MEQFFVVAFVGDGTAPAAGVVATSLLGVFFLGLWGIVGGAMLILGRRIIFSSKPEMRSKVDILSANQL